LPEATEALPWGERVAKVNNKVFVFLGQDMDPHFGFSVKLPTSKYTALALPFTQPTGYNLGKSGWVSAKLEPGAKLSFEQARDWVLESYCAVAPKALAAQVRGGSLTEPTKRKSKSATPAARATRRAVKKPKLQ